MKPQCKSTWDTCEKLNFTIFACRARQKRSGGGMLCASRWTKEKELGQPFSIKGSNLESTQSLLQWEVLCDSSCQTDPRFLCCLSTVLLKERQRSVLFQSLHQRMGKTPSSKYNYCAGKLVQMCHALQQLLAALIAVALQSSHSTNDCVFTQIGHREDEELSFFLSLCGFFFLDLAAGLCKQPWMTFSKI